MPSVISILTGPWNIIKCSKIRFQSLDGWCCWCSLFGFFWTSCKKENAWCQLSVNIFLCHRQLCYAAESNFWYKSPLDEHATSYLYMNASNFPGGLTYYEAVEFCKERGGIMAEPRSWEQSLHLVNMIKDKGDNFWIGNCVLWSKPAHN